MRASRMRGTGKYRVRVIGFDYYDAKNGRIESGGPSRIAMWMLDTDYDGRSLYPQQVFFPMAAGGGGRDDGWGNLARAAARPRRLRRDCAVRGNRLNRVRAWRSQQGGRQDNRRSRHRAGSASLRCPIDAGNRPAGDLQPVRHAWRALEVQPLRRRVRAGARAEACGVREGRPAVRDVRGRSGRVSAAAPAQPDKGASRPVAQCRVSRHNGKPPEGCWPTGGTQGRARSGCFSARIEAIETIIWMTESDESDRAGLDVPGDGGEFRRLCLKMATGTGKTVVMAMLIAWQALNKAASPADGRFSQRFLVMAPGLTVKVEARGAVAARRRRQLLPPVLDRPRCNVRGPEEGRRGRPQLAHPGAEGRSEARRGQEGAGGRCGVRIPHTAARTRQHSGDQRRGRTMRGAAGLARAATQPPTGSRGSLSRWPPCGWRA